MKDTHKKQNTTYKTRANLKADVDKWYFRYNEQLSKRWELQDSCRNLTVSVLFSIMLNIIFGIVIIVLVRCGTF